LIESPCDSQAGGVEADGQNELRWLAAYTRPKFEATVAEYCRQRSIEAFLPSHKCWRRWSDRKKLVDLPLFPSYVFMRVDENERGRAVQAPGLLWFVHNSFGPVKVEDAELSAIRSLTESGLQFDPMPNVPLGAEVEVVRGALQGHRGRLLRKDSGVIALTISAINGAVRVNLPDPTWVRLVRQRRPQGTIN